MSPQPKKAAPVAKTAVDLTPDEVDAVLRDPNVPGDVRGTVAAHYNVSRYLDTVEFTEETVRGDDGKDATILHITRPEA